MRSETPPTAVAGDAGGPAPATPARRTFVVLMILVTAALFAGMLALLFYNWARQQEPSSVIVVEGTPKFDGVEVTVEGVGLDEPYTATLSPERNYSMRFYLDAGYYTIRLSQDGRTLMQTEFEMGTREGKKLDLSKNEHILRRSATAPATTSK